MPRRTPSALERELFDNDPKIQGYIKDLEEAGSILGGKVEEARLAARRIVKARAEIRADETKVRQAKKEQRALKTRLSHIRDMKRRRQDLLIDRHYKEQVNPLRKELGLSPLKIKPERNSK